MIETIGLPDSLADKIVDIVLSKTVGQPLSAAQIQIILPTRRACLAVKNAFLKRSLKQSMLLPQLKPLYELDELAEGIPPALPVLKRTLMLQKLCAAKPNITTPEQALKVAVSLGEVLDEFYQFETSTEHLADLVQNPVFAEHWNETVVFLDIITKEWPKVLAEKGLIDEADRRIRLIDSYARRIRQSDSTIIAAGLDGGLPAVRRLLKTVNGLKNGLILMEGLDTSLTDSEWNLLPENHYQFGFKCILDALGKKPSSVRAGGMTTPREALIREAFKPEEKTEEWQTASLSPDALNQVTRIDCDTDTDEALTIALLLRGALEKPTQTAALVTPDRNLARRVISEMKRWGILLDDSAGTPILNTEVGIFFHLIAKVGLSHKDPMDVRALLKHPLAADGQNPMAFRKNIKALEKQARSDQSPFAPVLKTDLDPFVRLFDGPVLTPFTQILKAHIQVAEALAQSHDLSGDERLWRSDAGKVLFEFLTNLMDYADLIGDIEPAFYPALLEILLNTVTVRPTYGMHPRLDILGPIEARFSHPDICIIGGLNEGIFPPLPETGPWLNRPMRQILGLPQPESKGTALAADFAHCFCAPTVYLTRAKKTAGTETIPSRFLARLEAALMGSHIHFPIGRNDWATALDQPAQKETICRPHPCPPVSARPRRLAVTKVELWMRNPYAVYARYILNLYPLKDLQPAEIQQLYGVAVHRALEAFVQENPNSADKSRLAELADHFMREVGMRETDRLFCRPRFDQMASFWTEQQSLTAGKIESSLTEVQGSYTFDVGGRPFTLTGTADRIDLFKNGLARVLDYKTGSVPSIKEVSAGYAPQLPLEAFLFLKGSFQTTDYTLTELTYWKLAAKQEDCKVICLTEKKPVAEWVAEAFEGLKTLIHTFDLPTTPYEACPVAGKEPTYNDYDHLARTAEWGHEEESSC